MGSLESVSKGIAITATLLGSMVALMIIARDEALIAPSEAASLVQYMQGLNLSPRLLEERAWRSCTDQKRRRRDIDASAPWAMVELPEEDVGNALSSNEPQYRLFHIPSLEAEADAQDAEHRDGLIARADNALKLAQETATSDLLVMIDEMRANGQIDHIEPLDNEHTFMHHTMGADIQNTIRRNLDTQDGVYSLHMEDGEAVGVNCPS